MTKSMPQSFFSHAPRPRLRRIFALWATVVFHLVLLGFMLQQVAPELLPIQQQSRPVEIPVVDIFPPPPTRPEPEPEPEELVQTVAQTTPPPIPVPRTHTRPLPEPVTTELPSPRPIVNPRPFEQLIGVPQSALTTTIGSGSELRSGLDYQCRRPVRYPRRAEINGWQGSVRLRARIASGGRLVAVDVAQSSGRSQLDKAAVDWLSRCTFSTPALDGASLERVGEVSVHFVLK